MCKSWRESEEGGERQKDLERAEEEMAGQDPRPRPGRNGGRRNSEEHTLFMKFKDDVSEVRIEELIKGYANLVNLIPPMKSFRWGKDVSAGNRNQGFTHVFESIFESTEAVAEFQAHPAHVEYANLIPPCVEKVIVFDYKPTIVNL